MAHHKRPSSSRRHPGFLALALAALLSPSGLFLASAAGIAAVGGGVMLHAALDERPRGTPLASPPPNPPVAAAPAAVPRIELEHDGQPISLVLDDVSEMGMHAPGAMIALLGTPPGGAGLPHGNPGHGSAQPAAPLHTAGLPASPGSGSPTGAGAPGGGNPPDGKDFPGGGNPDSSSPTDRGTPLASEPTTPEAGAPNAPSSNEPKNPPSYNSGTPPANPALEKNSSPPGQTNPLADAPPTGFPLAYVPGRDAPPGEVEGSLPSSVTPSTPGLTQSATVPVPEPSTVGLMLLGLAGLAWAGRRRTAASAGTKRE